MDENKTTHVEADEPEEVVDTDPVEELAEEEPLENVLDEDEAVIVNMSD